MILGYRNQMVFLAYIIGIIFGWWYGKKILVKRFQIANYKFDLKEFDDLVTYIIISIIVGGRPWLRIFLQSSILH